MDLTASVAKGEQSLINALQERQAGIDDSTGKGLATERLIEERLIAPYLPPGFKCVKGEVVQAGSDEVSPPIDRIVYDERACPPLLIDETHSLVPIECTAGVVEITMWLDAQKLREDIARTKVVHWWRKRRLLINVSGEGNLVHRVETSTGIGCRCFVIGLPANPNWGPQAIVDTFRDAVTADDGTHVHALYVLGIGVFENHPTTIQAWLGHDRLFRFVTAFRNAFDRWPPLQYGVAPDLAKYVTGEETTFPKP